MLTGGQRGDSPQFTTVLDRIRVPRLIPHSTPRSTSSATRSSAGSTGSSATEAGIPVVNLDRAVATRYDKLAVRYEATVQVAAINEWL